MNMGTTPITEDNNETDIDRANRILKESIEFRTTVVASIHATIFEDSWSGWGQYHPHSNTSKSRTVEKTLKFIDTTCAEMGKGKRHYIGSVKY